MGGLDHFLLPATIVYALFNILPTLYEIDCYYRRGGLVMFDWHNDDTFHPHYTART